MKFYRNAFLIFLSFISINSISLCDAATRWSSLHWLPDADLLDNNDFVVDVNAFYFSDSADGAVIQPGAMLTYSIVKWVNFDIGYTGNVTLGLKARVLGEESSAWMPSLALGIRGCIANREFYYYDQERDEYTNELYFVFAKSIEPIRLRLHLGMLSIPSSKREAANPFIALEKYFGGGVYATVEMQRRDKEFMPSVFASWRFMKSRIEINAGAVALNKLLFDDNSDFDAGITSMQREGVVRPGIYFGVRYRGNIGKVGTSGGIETLENQVREHKLQISMLRYELDSLKKDYSKTIKNVRSIDSSLTSYSDSTFKSKDRYRTVAVEKLNALRVFYSQEPFEPELVKKGYSEIVGYRNEMVPTLLELSFDRGLDKKIRTLAVSVLGQIGSPQALDALIDILGQSKEPDVMIEALIALGNNKETRAEYLMKQLSNDPNEALAFTAQEVLKKIELQTGSKSQTSVPGVQLPSSIPESKIKETGDTASVNKKPVPQPAPLSKETQSDSIIWHPDEPVVPAVKSVDSTTLKKPQQPTVTKPDSVDVKAPAAKETRSQSKSKK